MKSKSESCSVGSTTENGELRKVVPIRPAISPEQRLTDQANFLREMADAMEQSNDVEQAAFAFVLRMKDGSTVVQASGWADDQRAQSYFLTFSRNHGWPT